jgi:hypothetical protein
MDQVKSDQVTEPANCSTERKPEETTALAVVDTTSLNAESLDILNQIIAVETTNVEKTKDLTYLFNANQNKKTMVRIDKLNGLQDKLVGLLEKRVTERPDEISNQEVMQAVKIVQDIMDRSTKNISGTEEQVPLIQINQQDNSVNMGSGINAAPRESRDRVKNAVMSILSGINGVTVPPQEVIDATNQHVADLQDEVDDD